MFINVCNAGKDRLHQKEKLFSILLIRGKTMRLAGWSLQKIKNWNYLQNLRLQHVHFILFKKHPSV
jgi:hypothetical protein